MAGLADIRDNPNYVNANAATKRAIFEKYSANDPAYLNANTATQAAIRQRFGIEQAAAPTEQPTEVPAPRTPQPPFMGFMPGPEMAIMQTVPVEKRPDVAKTVLGVAGGLAAGPLLGTAVRGAGVMLPALSRVTGPLSTALESGGFRTGLGVGPANTLTTRAGLRLVGGGTTGGVATGLIEPQDIGTGTVVGAAAPFVLPPIMKPIAAGTGAVIDWVGGKVANARANRLIRATLGDQLNSLRAAMSLYPDELPSRVAANMNLPELQTLLSLAEKSSRGGTINTLRTTEAENTINELSRIAGGATSEEARAAREGAKETLRQVTAPMREESITAAKKAGEIPKLDEMAATARKEASENVAKVRKWSDLVNKTDDWARNWVNQSRLVEGEGGAFTRQYVSNQGVGEPGARLASQAEQRYTYPGQLASSGRQTTVGGPFERQVIDEGGAVAQQIDKAAQASLKAGARARTAQAVSDSMKARGLEPLSSDTFAVAVDRLMANPEISTNPVLKQALPQVKAMFQDYANEHGVVSPEALISIRKNGISGIIQNLMPGADEKSQSRMAAKILSGLRSTIDDALENAGAKNWKNFLTTFERGMNDIKGMELADQIRKLYVKGTPDAMDQIVDLVKGESPDVIENLFGSGRFKIGEQVAKDMPFFRKLADRIGLDIKAAEQAKRGAKPLSNIIEEQSLRVRFPFLSNVSSVTNLTIDALERKLKRKTMDRLVYAATSGKNFNEILDALPAAERNPFLSQFKNAESWDDFTSNVVQAAGAQISGTPRNRLAPPSQNALAQ